MEQGVGGMRVHRTRRLVPCSWFRVPVWSQGEGYDGWGMGASAAGAWPAELRTSCTGVSRHTIRGVLQVTSGGLGRFTSDIGENETAGPAIGDAVRRLLTRFLPIVPSGGGFHKSRAALWGKWNDDSQSGCSL